MSLDRGGLERLVPLAKLLSPELALEDLLRPPEALRDLALRNRDERLVDEAVDVPVLQGVDQHSVEAGELAETPHEGLGVHPGPVARHGAREVNRVQVPRTGPRR